MKKPISLTTASPDVFRDIVALHGWEAQSRQLSEEMAELTVALDLADFYGEVARKTSCNTAALVARLAEEEGVDQ